jgi:glutamine cyclotransferase
MDNQKMTNQHPRAIIRQRVFSAMILLIAVAMLLSGCLIQSQKGSGSIPPEMSPHMTYEVVNAYPHDPAAFTQGLIYHEGYLYESTGLYGESSLRKVVLETGEVLQRVDLPANTFGEGLALWEDRLIQLTWQEGTGFVYALADFSPLGQFTYLTEGWGLTQDGSRLIMSDGSHRLYFMDPESYQIIGEVEVFDQDQPVERLNELAYINGEVFANIWLTDEIVRIDPNSGEVTGRIELQGILPENLITPTTDVLNGIAYDPEENRLFVTGKNWPLLFEIRLVPRSDAQ